MPLIHLITGVDMPKPDPETHLVVTALRELGATGEVVPWRGPGSGSDAADAVLVRSPWDYTRHREEFLAWCRETDERAPVHNPPRVIAWNSHKEYLLELARAGIPTVPTIVLRRGDQPPDPLGEWERMVIKPAVSSGATGAGRFAAADPGAADHLRDLLRSGDALVQPFAESVAAGGERSLIFLGGAFSHAVNKLPATGDYRVQESRGGTVAVHAPTTAEMEVAVAATALVEDELVYARVDLVELAGAPHVIELELIEPELFLGVHPEAPARLARQMLDRLPC